jgi:hypothetical protein
MSEVSHERSIADASAEASSVRLMRPSEVVAELAELPPAVVDGILPVGLTTFFGKPGEGSPRY